MPPTALIDDMGVANVGFLIENLGKDAGDLQYLRELVQNSIESIQRANRPTPGQIIVDFETVNGVRKLRISDNGVGMTPDEVSSNINRLSASAGIQAFDKNFGIGAKITAAVRNPVGVMYKCWKAGEGSLTVLGRADGRYGRLGWPSPDDDGTVVYWLPVPNDDRPAPIEDDGVSVVLLGRTEEEDTTFTPPGADVPSQWVSAYLERRYFEIPNGITLRVLRPKEIIDSERGIERAIYDTIRGQRFYLDKHSVSRGLVELPDAHARVHWWLLNEKIGEGGKTWNNRGHVGALFQGELYEVRAGQSRMSALKDFGIYAGFQRVVVYVEPTNVLGANTSRSLLIIKGGQPIDYSEVGAGFADRMPDELAAFMAGQVTTEQTDHRKAIKKNIQEVEQALEQARYQRSKTGKLEHLQPEHGGRPSLNEESRPRRVGGPSRPSDATGRVGTDYLRRAREELERRLRGRKIDTDPTPKIRWDEEGADVSAGRAASYTKATHVVVVTAKSDFYLDMLGWAVDELRKRAPTDMSEEAVGKICQDEVRKWFEQALAEAVVVLRPMEYDPRWSPAAAQIALSDEALTVAVVSHRWHMMAAIKRGLAGRMGGRREVA